MEKYIEYVNEFQEWNEYWIYFIENQLKKYLENNEENQTDIEHILDFLYHQKKKYKTIWYKTILEKAEAWNKKLIEQASSKDDEIEWVDYKTIKDFWDWFKIVQLISKSAYNREWKLMIHCVASYYGRNVEIYSLRDKKNLPHCTLEKDNQIKGEWNWSVHPKYIKYIVEFLEDIWMNVRQSEMKNLWYTRLKRNKYLKDEVELFRDMYYYWEITRDLFKDEYKIYIWDYKWNLDNLEYDYYTWNFYCYNNKLTSLEWMKEVLWNFDCSTNTLTSLKWMKEVWWDFYCYNNKLTSLEWVKEVWWDFDYSNNNLTSLKWMKEVWWDFNCRDNKLTSLKWMKEVWWDFYCYNNKLTSLKWMKEVWWDFYCYNNKLTSFKWMKKVWWRIYTDLS